MSNYTLFVQRVLTTSSLCIAAGYLASSPAQALQFNFNNITHNNVVNKLTGERQLLVDVTDSFGKEDLASNNVLFKFSNVGPFASSMTQIYFDNSTVLKSMGTIVDSGAGVDFAAAAGRMNLPGGNTVNFSPDFGIKSTGAVSQNGVNPGEWVSVFFNLSTNKTLKDVFNDLKSGSLRVGMHVQAFSNEGSEAFVNNNTPVVTTTPPPVVTTTPPPVVTTTPPPVVTTTPPPVVTTTPPPVVTTTPPPVVTTTPLPVVKTTPLPVVTTTPPPEVKTTPPPVTTSVLVPNLIIQSPSPKKVSEPGITLVLGIVAGKLVLRRRTKAII